MVALRLCLFGAAAASIAATGCLDSTARTRARDAALDAELDAGRVGRRDVGPDDASRTFDVYVDPGCPTGPGERDGAPPFLPGCDPYVPGACGPGSACYPIVTYPSGPCGDEVFVTECLPAGAGSQGAHCLTPLDCAHGYSCFVTGEGNQCLQLCDQRGREPRCPRGLICGWTDLPEYGACN